MSDDRHNYFIGNYISDDPTPIKLDINLTTKRCMAIIKKHHHKDRYVDYEFFYNHYEIKYRKKYKINILHNTLIDYYEKDVNKRRNEIFKFTMKAGIYIENWTIKWFEDNIRGYWTTWYCYDAGYQVIGFTNKEDLFLFQMTWG